MRCNYDQEFLEEAHFPNFYKLLLHYFAELKSSYNPQESDQEFIFNNKQIPINGRRQSLLQDRSNNTGIKLYLLFAKYYLHTQFKNFLEEFKVISILDFILKSYFGNTYFIYKKLHVEYCNQ